MTAQEISVPVVLLVRGRHREPPVRARPIDRAPAEGVARDLAGTPGAGSCLDAEMLAAWVEGGLVGGQLIAAQEHVAGCSACQATLAALVRTTPTELVAGAMVATRPQRTLARPRSGHGHRACDLGGRASRGVHAAAGTGADGRRSSRCSPQTNHWQRLRCHWRRQRLPPGTLPMSLAIRRHSVPNGNRPSSQRGRPRRQTPR